MDNILGAGFVVIVLTCIIGFVNVANTLGRIESLLRDTMSILQDIRRYSEDKR